MNVSEVYAALRFRGLKIPAPVINEHIMAIEEWEKFESGSNQR